MTDIDLRAGYIHRGLGVVVRWQNIALVIPSDAEHDAVVDDMFANLAAEPTSQDLIRAINSMLAENQLRSVGMVVEATGGPMAVAFGPVEVLIDDHVAISGVDGLVKQQISGTADRLTLRAAGLEKAADPVPPFDLRKGVAPGGGLTLARLEASAPPKLGDITPGHVVPMAAPEAGTAPGPVDEPALNGDSGSPESNAEASNGETSDVDEPDEQPDNEPTAEEYPSEEHGTEQDEDPEEETASLAASALDAENVLAEAQTAIETPFQSVLLSSGATPAALQPLPLASATTGDESAGDQLVDGDRVRDEVDGILCSRAHFNNPTATYCMVCGVSVAHLTPNPVTRPRPTLGFIVFDDGSSFGLDRSYLIGREPVAAEGQRAELLVIHDNNDTLSRTHAELRLVDWNVQLVDLGSTNGTYIWDQEYERWNQLTAGHAVELHSGETVALGRRTFVFEGVGQTI